MNLQKSGNPTLSDKIFKKVSIHSDTQSMTIKGTISKFFLMVILVISSASYTWKIWFTGQSITGWLIGGILIGLVLAMVIMFKPHLSSYLVPIYALAQGLFLGGISAIIQETFQESYPNIILVAVGLTFGVVLSMVLLYYLRIIQPTQKFKSIVISGTIGIGIFYFLTILLGMFGIQIPLMYSNSIWGIGFSLFVIVIAALNLILDFERIEKFSSMGAPKYMEWYCSFGLTVTVIWLYIEILRLLSKLVSNR